MDNNEFTCKQLLEGYLIATSKLFNICEHSAGTINEVISEIESLGVSEECKKACISLVKLTKIK